MDIISDRAPFFLSSSPSPHALPRKHSAPIGPYRPSVSDLAHSHPLGRGSLLPMPPNYNEGSCWTLASLKVLNSSPPEIRPRTISVEVTKISLRMDGRWAEEKPYILRRSWDEWIELRERIIQMYPETEPLLPKLSKTHGFLESIFPNSKRHQHSTQNLNMKELNSFLSCLVGKCSKRVINSRIIQNFFQTEEMRVGVYQVQYTDDDLPVVHPHSSRFDSRRDLQPPPQTSSGRDDASSIASHLKAFRFPEPNPLQFNPSPGLKTKTSQPNLALSLRAAAAFEAEKNLYHNEKVSPLNRHRPSVDPMAVIVERPPPPGSIPELQTGHILRPNPMGRNLGASTIRLPNKSRNPMRPTTGLTRPPPMAPSKRPNTSDARSAHDAMLKPTPINNMKYASSHVTPAPPTRRPSENYLGFSRELEASKPPRPQLREFKSMQDIRGTANHHLKASGRPSRNGAVDPIRNNSLSAVGENPQVVGAGSHVRSPTNPWRRHRRTPSDSSSSFGSSQLSPISSVLSSPTVTPSTSTNVTLNSASSPFFPFQIGPRRSIDSLGPSSTGCDGSTSLRLVHDPETRKTVAHHTVPPAPFYPIPPRLLKPITIPSPTNGLASSHHPPTQCRPHTSAGSANGRIPSSLTLKVIHLESKTNIILSIQRGLFSLAQIRAKIQNKLKMAGEVELEPDWKIRLVMVDQEEFVRRGDELEERKELDPNQDDGVELLELINGNSKKSLIKKITLRIS